MITISKIKFFLIMLFVLGIVDVYAEEVSVLHQNHKTVIIDSLKLRENELPKGYKFGKDIFCKNIQPAMLYKEHNLYGALIGEAIKKDFQSISNENGDAGSILYFQFKKRVEESGKEFIKGLIWGENSQPTKQHPESIEFFEDVMVIWCFEQGSLIYKLSREKILLYLEMQTK